MGGGKGSLKRKFCRKHTAKKCAPELLRTFERKGRVACKPPSTRSMAYSSGGYAGKGVGGHTAGGKLKYQAN